MPTCSRVRQRPRTRRSRKIKDTDKAIHIWSQESKKKTRITTTVRPFRSVPPLVSGICVRVRPFGTHYLLKWKGCQSI